MRYSKSPRKRRYVKGYGFLPFAKNIGRNLSNKYGQKLVDSATKSATDALKTVVNLILTWSTNGVIVASNVANQNATFSITDTKLYLPVVTLSTQDNAKLLQQLKSGFKRLINWNKYLSKPELLVQNPNLNHLVEPRSK